MDAWQRWATRWQQSIETLAFESMTGADSGHDIAHVQRVAKNAIRIGTSEAADPSIVLPAAWLHDCVFVPKNSSERNQASRLASKQAVMLLEKIGYPVIHLQSIAHAIVAHSFSANVTCETLEAKVVQDADRLEAVGAIGIARCLMTGGSMNQRLYDPEQPFPADRDPSDTTQSIDHFFQKLLRLPATMQTESGRREAASRTHILKEFLRQLAYELDTPKGQLEMALAKLENLA